MAIKLLHCADLHLDATLGDSVRASTFNELSAPMRIRLRDAPINALREISKICSSENIDVVVIAGDIFDKKENTSVIKSAQMKFGSFLRELDEQNIQVFIALGNHDPLSTINEMKSMWPKNTHVFSTTPESIEINVRNEKVVVHGASFATNDESRNLASSFPNKVQDAYNVGVLHTNVSGNTDHKNYAPSSLDTLTSLSYDYFALGHIHKREVISEHPLVAYSGNSQGLSAKPSEQEPKGCYVVSIDTPNTIGQVTFKPTDDIRYKSLHIKCEAESFDDLMETFDDAIRECQLDSSKFYLVRAYIELSGMQFYIDEDVALEHLNQAARNFLVTKVEFEQSHASWEDLVDTEDFFAKIDEILSSTNFNINIYDSKQQKVEAMLPSTYEPDSVDEKDHAINAIVSTYAELKSKGTK